MKKITREIIKRSLFPCFCACTYAAVLDYHWQVWAGIGALLIVARARMRAEDFEEHKRRTS
jgi:hypothetical protein